MGTRVAPCYANIFMGWFEDNYVSIYEEVYIHLYLIWTHSHTQLEELVQHLNQCMPSTNFKTEASQEKEIFIFNPEKVL